MEEASLATRRARIAVTLVLVWLISLVILMTGIFQPDPSAHITDATCAPGDTCPTGTECFAVDGLRNGSCVEPGYVEASCAWYETGAVAESYPQQVVCSTNPFAALMKIVLAPFFTLAQVL